MNKKSTTQKQQRFLATLYMNTRDNRYSHCDVSEAFFIPSQRFQKIFGEDYKAKIDGIIRCVDESFKKKTAWAKGKTRAYVFTPEGEKLVASFKLQPQRRPTTPGSYYEEKINVHALQELLTSPDNFKNKEDYLCTQLYMQHVDKAEGINFVTYRRTGRIGRRFANAPSLQSLPKYVRYAIINDCTDIDMVNAHPTLMLALAKKHGIDTKALNAYISKREEALTHIQSFYSVDRKAAKQLVLMISYGARANISSAENAFSTWAKDNGASLKYDGYNVKNSKFIDAFSNEIMNVKMAVIDNEIQPSDRTGNSNRDFAIFLQHIEDRALSLVEAYMHYRSIKVSSLMFDGLLVQGHISNEHLHEIEKHLNKFLAEQFQINTIDLKLSKQYYK